MKKTKKIKKLSYPICVKFLFFHDLTPGVVEVPFEKHENKKNFQYIKMIIRDSNHY